MSSWINGIYFANAIASVMSKKAKYPDQPYDFWKDNDKKKLETKEEKEIIIKNAMNQFEKIVGAINNTRKRRGGE